MKVLTSMLFFSAAAIAQDVPHSYMPTDGYVPNESTAIRIALAVWEPIYGEKTIASEKPYRATLSNGVWLVMGSLPSGFAGGVAIAEISQRNATVLRVSHGK